MTRHFYLEQTLTVWRPAVADHASPSGEICQNILNPARVQDNPSSEYRLTIASSSSFKVQKRSNYVNNDENHYVYRDYFIFMTKSSKKVQSKSELKPRPRVAMFNRVWRRPSREAQQLGLSVCRASILTLAGASLQSPVSVHW